MTCPRLCRGGLAPGVQGARSWHKSLGIGLDVTAVDLLLLFQPRGLWSLEGPDWRHILP